MSTLQVNLPFEAISAFCRKWQITRLEVFGSALRDDFRADSDIDSLATFAPDSRWSLFDLAAMQCELEDILGRKVDFVDRISVERSPRPRRREAILNSGIPVYERV